MRHHYSTTFPKNTPVLRFAIFTLIVGTITGYYAALSDAIVPWEDLSQWQIFNYVVANILNEFAFWLILGLPAACGGAIGGLIGHFMKKYPAALIVLLGFALFRLQGTLTESWQSPIGLPRNIFLCLVIAGIAGYWLISVYRKRKGRKV